jgi:prepilin-type N-terminal cleavage/methylation domain-containing protein
MRAASRGFTLLEIAVAIAILGTGVVTLQQIYQGSLRLQERASRHSRAVLHARAAIDSLLFQRGVSDLNKEETTKEGFKTHYLVRDATPEEGGETPEQRENDPIGQKLKYVEVTVTWQDGAGAKDYTLRSLRMSHDDDEDEPK